MAIGTQKYITFSSKDYKDLKSYCELNGLDEDKVIKDSYSKGFNIERYGLLSGSVEFKEPKIEYIEKEVIKYVEQPIEVIKEVEVIKEIVKEIPSKPIEVEVIKYVDREVIKEIPVEKVIERIVNVHDNTQVDILIKKIEELENRPPEVIEVIKEVFVEKKVESNLQPKLDALQSTLQKLKQENIEKDKKIKEQEILIQELKSIRDNVRATYLRGSNLDDKLYK